MNKEKKMNSITIKKIQDIRFKLNLLSQTIQGQALVRLEIVDELLTDLLKSLTKKQPKETELSL